MIRFTLLLVCSFLPITASAQTFPGNGGSFDVRIGVDSLPSMSAPSIVTAGAGQTLFVRAESAGAVIDFAPLWIFADLFVGAPPSMSFAFGNVQNLWLDPTRAASFMLIAGPTDLLGPELLVVGGNLYSFFLPVSLAPLSVMIQGLVASPASLNGFYELSRGTVIHFL